MILTNTREYLEHGQGSFGEIELDVQPDLDASQDTTEADKVTCMMLGIPDVSVTITP